MYIAKYFVVLIVIHIKKDTKLFLNSIYICLTIKWEGFFILNV